MKKIQILFIVLMLGLTSCTQRGCQAVERGVQFSERYYQVSLFSGGKIVKQYTFKGIVNQETNSEGVYWIQDGKLIEISGDYIIESSDNTPFQELNFETVVDTSAKVIKK